MFQPARLKWKGDIIEIPPDRVMTAIAAVEEHLTIHELIRYAERGTQPFSKMAQGFSAALRTVGVRVSPEDVYRAMVKGSSDDIMGHMSALLALMGPPEDIDLGKAEALAKVDPPASTRGEGRRSKRRTR